MRVGVAKETKKHEYRVGATPACVRAYVEHGHTVQVEAGAGGGAGYNDRRYAEAGAELVTDRRALFAEAELLIKVKEPVGDEPDLLQPGQILYTYLHLAANRTLTEALLQRGIIGVAYETIEKADGQLPCLQPMSEIAGRMAVQEGAKYLEKAFGGRGILLGGVPGVRRGVVAILGAGVVGLNAAKISVGIGADVRILDINHSRLAYLDDVFGSSLQTLYSNRVNLERCLRECDVLIGAVLVPGASTPGLVSRQDLSLMKDGAVLVDVAVDQGGCAESSRPTTHDQPTYVEEGVVHYCVSNMPGAVALTSTLALTNQTLSYGLEIADNGIEAVVRSNPELRSGLNLYNGKLVNEAVASSLGMEADTL